jgi:antitoxin VapB
MSLSIKNPEAHKLVRELAEETGETITQAVTLALRERLHRVRQKRDRKEISIEEMRAIAHRIRMSIKGRITAHAKLLYDESGLPK